MIFQNFINSIYKSVYFRWFRLKLKTTTLPGLKGKSIFHTGKFFFDSISDEDLHIKAGSLSYSFFLALFPAIILLFTSIAYLPIANLENKILEFSQFIIPRDVYNFLETTIHDIVKRQRTSLLSFSFISAIFFASNGMNTMMSAFAKYESDEDKRSWFHKRLRSIGLTLLVVLILILTLALTTSLNVIIGFIDNNTQIYDSWIKNITIGVKYLGIVFFTYLNFSSLYYVGSSKQANWHFFSLGSSVATLLFLMAIYGLNYYINNFNRYNELYGSIGTLLIVMLLFYVYSAVLIIGFELNSGIDKAKKVASDL